jgi:hypothetical protein
VPQHFRLYLQGAHQEDMPIASLPYVGPAPFIYRDYELDSGHLVQEAKSLQELRSITNAAFYHDGSTLYMRFRPQDQRDFSAFDVCRVSLCQ